MISEVNQSVFILVLCPKNASLSLHDKESVPEKFICQQHHKQEIRSGFTTQHHFMNTKCVKMTTQRCDFIYLFIFESLYFFNVHCKTG